MSQPTSVIARNETTKQSAEARSLTTSSLIVVVLAGVFVIATVMCGWWGVPITAALWGLVCPHKTLVSVFSVLASTLAWALLLGFDAWHAPMGELLRILGDVFHLPAPGTLLITLLFPAALAWSATEVCTAIRLRVVARSPSARAPREYTPR